MKKMGSAGTRWLKTIHLFFVCSWVGGALSLLLVFFLSGARIGRGVYAVDAALKLIDDFVIIPGALGCLLTGLIYGIWTKWGFFRSKWLTVKWVMTVVQILFGTFFLGPWLNGSVEISRSLGEGSLRSPDYLHNGLMNSIWGPVQVFFLLAMVWISVARPWRK